MEIERNLVQSEWAGFTVTKKRSNKSAPALRTVNPRSSIFSIQPATAKLIKLVRALLFGITENTDESPGGACLM